MLGSRSAVLQRRLKIAEWIRRHGTTRVDALSAALQVSAVTIRGDLAYLEEQGLIVRSSGTARPTPVAETVAADPIPRSRLRPLLLAAAALVGPSGTLLLAPGSLTTQLIPHLPASDRLGLVLCSVEALLLARACMDGPLHLLGGRLGRDGSSLEGPWSVQALATHQIDLFVCEAAALASDGVLLPTDLPPSLHQAAAQRADRTIVLIPGDGQRPRGQTRLEYARISDVLLTAAPADGARKGAHPLANTGLRLRPPSAAGIVHYRRDPASACNDKKELSA